MEKGKGSEAFTIRGHHLSSFTDTIPEVQADIEILRLKRDHFPQSQQSVDYFDDIFGKTREDYVKYTKRSVDLMKRFQNLPDDHTVEVIAARDEICKTCPIVGNHCRVSEDTYGLEGRTRISRDKKGIKRFGSEATRLGFTEEVVTFTSVTDYVDRENVTIQALRTNAGVARSIFERSNILRRPL